MLIIPEDRKVNCVYLFYHYKVNLLSNREEGA